MARRSRGSSGERSGRTGPVFPRLGPTGTAIPISTGTARLLQETDGSVLLEVNGVPSSHHHPDPRHLVFEYMRWMQLVADPVLESRAADHRPEIAHLGGGGCSLPRALAASCPAARQIVVELDGRLAELVREWFDLPRSPALRLRVEDAATALRSWREDRFDLLIRDVFAGDRTPASLQSLTAAQHAARVLRPSGLYLVNSAGGPSPTDRLADELVTLRAAFAHVGVIVEPAVLTGRRRGNSVLVASASPLPEGIDRALRSDPVSVRLAAGADLERLAARGRVLREDGDPDAASPAERGPAVD